MKKYKTIIADPPWQYKANHDRNGSARGHYTTMSDADITAMPFGDLAADDAVLLMWATWPKLKNACLPAMGAWGFDYITGFPWIKVSDIRPSLFGGYKIKPTYGTGFWFRGCTELLLLGKRGKPKVSEMDFAGLLGAAVIHSKKPADLYEYAESLDGPYLELFARRPRTGWDVWGNEVENSIKIPLDNKRQV